MPAGSGSKGEPCRIECSFPEAPRQLSFSPPPGGMQVSSTVLSLKSEDSESPGEEDSSSSLSLDLCL